MRRYAKGGCLPEVMTKRQAEAEAKAEARAGAVAGRISVRARAKVLEAIDLMLSLLCI